METEKKNKFASKGDRIPSPVIPGEGSSYLLAFHQEVCVVHGLKDVIKERDGSHPNYCSDAHSVGKNQIVDKPDISRLTCTLKQGTR